MSAMSGAEMARLVLGYLQSQKMEQIAMNFAKESPYLYEEYRCIKRGIKMKQINRSSRSLHQILKEFIGIEDIVTELFDDELNEHEPMSVPYELLQIKTLRDKVKYFYQKYKSLKNNMPSQSESQSETQIQSTSSGAASRKRPNISNISQNSSDSELMEQSSTHSASEQDSSNYSRPSKRRRLIDDPDLMIDEYTNAQKAYKTPMKVILTSQHKGSTSSKCLQMSSSNLHFGSVFSESMRIANSDFPQLIAQQINVIPCNKRQDKASDIADDLAGNLAGNSMTQDFLESIFNNGTALSPSAESRAYSEADCEIVPTDENRELNTPLPNESSSSRSRYDLRSNRKSSLGASSSVESKRKNEKPQILSNERVDILPKSALSQCRSEPIELSDSDTEAVTTTSQQHQSQQQLQPQPYYVPDGLIQVYNAENNTIILMANPNIQSLLQYQAATSTVECPTVDTAINPATNSNVINDSQFTVNEGSQVLSIVVPNQNGVTISDDERNRLIVINSDDVNTEGSQTVQPMQIDQQISSANTLETAAKQSQNTNEEEQTLTDQIEKDKTDQVAQLKQISSQKVITPKQFIKSNIPGTSRSLSTPRNRNPHVRVLDFNCTPNRFRLSEINENKNDSISNTSRFFNETPHNRSIASSLPSSAPPKVDSTIVQNRRISMEKTIESSTADVFVPSDENTQNTVISGDGETPKVRKSNRRSCVRSISSHKENHPDDERSKRIATTKKKICPDDVESNANDKNNEKSDTIPASNEEAMAAWRKMRDANKNPELFEQQLREQNSKKQANEHSTVRKKRPSRSKKKPAAATAAAARKKQTNKTSPDDSTKPEDTSLNSTIDSDLLNSTQLNLEAQLLEANLKSAKKATPVKQTVHKSAKKKTPKGKLQIKLMPSPKNKVLKRLRSAKNLVTANEKDKNGKNDTNVNSTSSDKINEAEVVAEGSDIANTQVESTVNNQISTENLEKSTDLHHSKAMEASEILIGMPEIIKQQEIERRKSQHQEIQHESISMSQQPVEAPTEPTQKTTNDPLPIDKSAAILLSNINQPNLNMSSLLETPFKDCGLAFPRTPNLSNILSQLNTPMVRHPCESLMNDSIFKNPQWPTPNFPITPGAMFSSLTPLKDVLSPRSEDIVYGAPNRPTDYSSSSSYYKPDESDGIDRQIQASIQSSRKNSEVYSADDLDESSKIDDTTQNTSRTSSSSSSSSSDSSSDSDSDSDSSSSSDSEGENPDENFAPDQNEQEYSQQQQQQQQIQLQPPVEDLVDDGNTQEIKSYLETTSHIAQNILLSKPNAPIPNKEEEQSKLLTEKRRRMQELLRTEEMRNHEKLKPKQIKKYNRAINEAKRDRLRGVQAISSPSKRKSTQPKKIISIQSQQIYSEVVNVQASTHSKQVIETNVHSTVVTERLKTDAAGDNAITDSCNASLKTPAVLKTSFEVEESLEAIQKHIDTVDVNEEPAVSKKNPAAPTTKESLVDMLSEKQKRFDANRPKAKTEVIDALPLTRATRSRAKSQRSVIAPAKNLITQTASTKPSTDSSKAQRRSKENKPNANSSLTNPNHKEKTISKPAEPSKAEAVKNKPENKFETPAKLKESRQKIRDLFGDCTDIETPIKSPPKTIKPSGGVGGGASSNVVEPKGNKFQEPPSNGTRSNKVEADSSNVNDDNSDDETDESDNDEEQYEMVLSIDESDKKRFFCIRENFLAMSNTVAKPIAMAGTRKVVLSGNIRFTLEPSDVMELYTQDVNSVAEMKKNKERTRSTKESKAEVAVNAEATQSESDMKYGKPLHTSTPSPTKSITPKFNIKHKATTMLSPKSAKKQKNDFNSIKIDDILGHLHPATE